MPEQIVHIDGVFPTVISISALVLGLYERQFWPAFPDLEVYIETARTERPAALRVVTGMFLPP